MNVCMKAFVHMSVCVMSACVFFQELPMGDLKSISLVHRQDIEIHLLTSPASGP